MSIIQGNAKQASTRGFYSFPIEQSLRFNDDDTPYLTWTPDSAGNRKTFTISVWVKRGNIGASSFYPYILDGGTSNEHKLAFVNDTLSFGAWAGSDEFNLTTTQLFRDTSAWYHIVVAQDTTQATASDRVKMYVNGEQVTSFSTSSYPSLNYEGRINNTNEHAIGRWQSGTSRYFDGYMAEVNFIDGTAYDADSFGELKNGVWIPKDPTGLTYGTNGFRLSFADDAEVEAFNTVLYRGSGSQQSITGMGFKPDLLWIKNRDTANNHQLMNSVIGVPNNLESNTTDAEDTTNRVSSLDNDGFTVEGSYSFTNQSGQSYVAWGWKAGDSNVSNTDGSITSTVRANTTYGFSIVSYSGTGANATIGHGLGATPDWIIVKNRDRSANWTVWHSALNQNQILELSTTAAVQTDNIFWNNTLPTSTVFAVAGPGDNSTNASGEDLIAYCWAEKAGYSKFGSYTGNGSSTGPTVTCGFKPAMIILKRTDSGGSWTISDNTRDTVNPVTPYLFPHASDAEATDSSNEIDFNDTGFQIKHDTRNNTSGATYIYAAFADTREAAFWLDQSGNDNDWQPVNLDHNDTVADSPTDNFATLNPLAPPSNTNNALSDGNLVVTATAASWSHAPATWGLQSGQWYWEVTTLTDSAFVGMSSPAVANLSANALMGWDDPLKDAYIYQADASSGMVRHNGSTLVSSKLGTPAGTVIGLAVDIDAGTLKFYVNNALQYTASDDFTGWFPDAAVINSVAYRYNFGQQPFKYDPPA